jgi:hypothetical protein
MDDVAGRDAEVRGIVIVGAAAADDDQVRRPRPLDEMGDRFRERRAPIGPDAIVRVAREDLVGLLQDLADLAFIFLLVDLGVVRVVDQERNWHLMGGGPGERRLQAVCEPCGEAYPVRRRPIQIHRYEDVRAVHGRLRKPWEPVRRRYSRLDWPLGP